MDTFFIIFLIIIIIEFFIFILLLSTIDVEIKDCDFSHIDKTIDKFKILKMKVSIKIKVFKKLLLFKITFDERYIDILKLKIRYKKADKLEIDLFGLIKKTKKLTNKYTKCVSEVLKPKIKRIDIYSAIGMADDMYTIFLLPLFTTYISFKMRDLMNKYNVEDYSYEIIPRYIKRVYFKIILNTNIEIKMYDLLRFILQIKRIKN